MTRSEEARKGARNGVKRGQKRGQTQKIKIWAGSFTDCGGIKRRQVSTFDNLLGAGGEGCAISGDGNGAGRIPARSLSVKSQDVTSFGCPRISDQIRRKLRVNASAGLATVSCLISVSENPSARS